MFLEGVTSAACDELPAPTETPYWIELIDDKWKAVWEECGIFSLKTVAVVDDACTNLHEVDKRHKVVQNVEEAEEREEEFVSSKCPSHRLGDKNLFFKEDPKAPGLTVPSIYASTELPLSQLRHDA